MFLSLLLLFYAAPSQALEFSAEYLLEGTTDLSDLDSNRTNFFGLATVGFDHSLQARTGLFSLHNSFLWLHGESLSTEIGDVNGFSNISGPEALRLNHLWLQYAHGSLTSRVGRFDVDEYFMGFESGANLLNSSFGALATVTANMPIPTYPVPGLAALVRYEYKLNSSITMTIMDGDVGNGDQHDNLGFDLGSSGVGGLFLLAEYRQGLDYVASSQPTTGNRSNSQFMFGLGLHSGEFAAFDNRQVDGNAVIYLGVEKQIYTTQQRALTTSLRLSAAPFDDRNSVIYQADLALTYQGAFNTPKGSISLGLVYAGLSDEFTASQSSAAAEWVAEMNYRYDFAGCCYMSPSIQYINGGTLKTDDIVVGML